MIVAWRIQLTVARLHLAILTASLRTVAGTDYSGAQISVFIVSARKNHDVNEGEGQALSAHDTNGANCLCQLGAHSQEIVP